MSEYTKLAIGTTEEFQVTSISEIQTGKWPEYVFHAADGRTFTAPKAAMDRQFAKLKLTPAQLAGHRIQIERAPNQTDASKSWWNLYLASESVETDSEPTITARSLKANPQGTAPLAPTRAAPTSQDPDAPLAGDHEKAERGRRFALYLDLYEYTAKALCVMGRRDGLEFSVDSVGINAAAATVWIDWQKNGLL